jgi:adenylate kinase family enzyme
LHIAPSGSPQPTKQAFICKLYSGFPRIFSQQKPHRRICIPQGARNEVLQETQPEPQIIFRRCFFRKTRKMSADVQAYFKRNLTPYSGNSAPNLESFFGDVFSQDKENKRRRTSVLQAKFDAVFGKLSPNLKSFFGDVFFARQGK